MKRFLIRTSLLAAFFLIAGYLLYTLVVPQLFTPSLIFLLFFIFVIANIVYAWLFTSLRKKKRAFTSAFMAVSFVKMFIYLIVVIGWAWIERENAKVILVNFLIMYIAFSVLEVGELVRLVKKRNS